MFLLMAWACLVQDPGLQSGYDGGFYIRGKDAKLVLEGLLQVNATAFERGGPHESEFVLRRMRLEFSGEFYERWLFHIEPKFLADGVELEEAWICVKAADLLIMFGRMKEPFSFEEMASTRHMDMVNFSILNQFVPAEDHGITVFGSQGVFQYQLGFYNGTGGDDTTSDKDGALRLVLHPGGGFQIGGAATFGRQKTDISNEDLTTEARVPWGEYLPGTELDGQRVRLGGEAAWLNGPFAATAEVIRDREEINDSTVQVTGGYVQASVVLTGEEKSWKGVKPAKPFLKDPDVGAWQLVARWSRLALDDEFAPFLTSFPKRIDSYTLGVTWYANDFVKVKINYLRTVFERDIVVASGRQDNEDALLFQFQLMF
jgi:phosphate-selective porin OprO/OprP